MKILNFDDVLTEVKGHIGTYLSEHQVIRNPTDRKHFKCISPDHDDGNPSMSLCVQGNFVKCWSCGVIYDTLGCASAVEGKGKYGLSWLEDNLMYLADKYEVFVEKGEMSDEEALQWRIRLAYMTAAEIVSDTKLGDYSAVDKEIETRGWDYPVLRTSQIGTVDYGQYIKLMNEAGFASKFLEEVDLNNKHLFNNKNLIFTIHNEKGDPVGFTARNLEYDGKNKKYFNSSEKNFLFCKKERLYNIHDARYSKENTTYIFESQASVNTALKNKMDNSVAIMSSYLSDEQIVLLKACNLYNVTLCLDGDKAGAEATRKILDERLGAHPDVAVSIVTLPAGKDPGDYIREKGIKKFKALKKISSFEWRLQQLPQPEDEGFDADDICNKMVPLIVSEPNRVKRDTYCQQLATYTDRHAKPIADEVERLSDINSHKRAAEINTAVDKFFKNFKKRPAHALSLIKDSADEIENIDIKYTADDLSEVATIEAIENVKKDQDELQGAFMGFHLNAFPQLQENLHGDWRHSSMLLVGGKENTGKTTITTKIAYEIATHPENNACVIYHTIDDPMSAVLAKMLCHSIDNKSYLNYMMNPKYYAKKYNDDSIIDKREAAYKSFVNLVKDGRLIIKDATNSSSINYGEKLIKYYKAKYPERNIVYILDNFHKLPEIGGSDQTRQSVTRMSNKIKNLSLRHNICTICVCEYKKLMKGQKPDNESLAEARALQYDATAVLHLYNDLHDMGEDGAKCVNMIQKGDDTIFKPRIELIFGKNKHKEFKGRQFLDFYPERATFNELSKDQVREDAAELKEFRKTQKRVFEEKNKDE